MEEQREEEKEERREKEIGEEKKTCKLSDVSCDCDKLQDIDEM